MAAELIEGGFGALVEDVPERLAFMRTDLPAAAAAAILGGDLSGFLITLEDAADEGAAHVEPAGNRTL